MVALALASLAADEPRVPEQTAESASYELIEVHVTVAAKTADGGDWYQWPRKQRGAELNREHRRPRRP